MKKVNEPNRRPSTSKERGRDKRATEYEHRDLYIEYAGNALDLRTLDQFLMDNPGVTRKQVLQWQKMPLVRNAIREKMDETLPDTRPLVLKAMMRDVQAGKNNAGRNYLEVTGQFVPQSKQRVEVGKHDDLNQMTEEELLKEAGKTAEEMKDDGTNWRDEAKVIRGGGE